MINMRVEVICLTNIDYVLELCPHELLAQIKQVRCIYYYFLVFQFILIIIYCLISISPSYIAFMYSMFIVYSYLYL